MMHRQNEGRGAGWNWRAHLTERERALIEHGDALIKRIEDASKSLGLTNRAAIIDRAVERARTKGDRA